MHVTIRGRFVTTEQYEYNAFKTERGDDMPGGTTRKIHVLDTEGNLRAIKVNRIDRALIDKLTFGVEVVVEATARGQRNGSIGFDALQVAPAAQLAKAG